MRAESHDFPEPSGRAWAPGRRYGCHCWRDPDAARTAIRPRRGKSSTSQRCSMMAATGNMDLAYASGPIAQRRTRRVAAR